MAEEQGSTPQGDSGGSARRSKSSRSQHNWAVMGPMAAAFVLLTVATVVAAYRFGEGVVYIGDRTISDFNLFEVTGGAALGVLGMAAGLVAAALGAVTALMATIVSVAMGALGIVIGTLVVVGMVTGPILLVAVLGVLIKRRYWPDVI